MNRPTKPFPNKGDPVAGAPRIRSKKSPLAVAITAALELDPTVELYSVAAHMVSRAEANSTTSKRAREWLGGVSHSTFCRWKRKLGLEVRVTRPTQKSEGDDFGRGGQLCATGHN
jgi:hypothetical protein